MRRPKNSPVVPPITTDLVAVPKVQSADTDHNGRSQTRGGRPWCTFPAIESMPVGGVTVGRHTLTKQAEMMESIVARIGRRLNNWLKTTPDVVPSGEFLEAFRYYQAALVSLLKEQRERARRSDESDSSPEQLEAQFKQEVMNAFRTFTPEDWALADRVRAEQRDTSDGSDDVH